MKVTIIKSVVLMHEVKSENHRLNIYAYAFMQLCNERLFNSSYLLSNLSNGMDCNSSKNDKNVYEIRKCLLITMEV